MIQIISKTQYKTLMKFLTELKIPTKISYQGMPEDKIISTPKMKFIIKDYYSEE